MSATNATAPRLETSPSGAGSLWRFAPMLRGFFARRVRGDVDDLVQDVMVRIETRRGGAEIENLEGYLFQVASSVLTDKLRRDRVRRRASHVELTESHHPVEVLSPERVLEAREQLALAFQVLEEAPERARQAFVLVRFEHMSYAAAAKHMGISVSAVEKHIMKVVRLLSERLRSPDDVARSVREPR